MNLAYEVFFHGIWESLPISSSWHMFFFFHTSPENIEYYHLCILPVLILLSIKQLSKIIKNLYSIAIITFLACIVYGLKKINWLNPIVLPDYITHFLAGIYLLFIAQYQYHLRTKKLLRFSISDQRSETTVLYIQGIGQAFVQLLPGFSRLAATLLPSTYLKVDFKQIWFNSFVLETPLLLLATCKHFYTAHALPSTHDYLMGSLGFSIGLILALWLEWYGIFLYGSYRLTLCLLILLKVI